MPWKTKKILYREQIEEAMRRTKSNRAAARYLNVSFPHYKKYALLYKDEKTGKSLWELQYNQGGKGIKKYALSDNARLRKGKEPAIMDILEGKIPLEHYNPEKLKYKLVDLGILECKCGQCGYDVKRPLDGKSPLILIHKNGDRRDWHANNLEFRCYNCMFINGGEPIPEEQIQKLENYQTNGHGKEPEWELDEYQQEFLKNLLPEQKQYRPGEEYISRL